jgi:hypothetical protein
MSDFDTVTLQLNLLLGIAGANPVTINITDSYTTGPMGGVSVAIWNYALSTKIIPGIETDVAGIAVFGLPTGSYQAILFKSGAMFANPFPFVVAGVPLTLNLQGTLQIISVPDAGKVTIYGYVLAPDSSPVRSSSVALTLNGRPQQIGNASVSGLSLSEFTNELGYFEFVVYGGINVTITIDQSGYSKSGVLPLSGAHSLDSLLNFR